LLSGGRSSALVLVHPSLLAFVQAHTNFVRVEQFATFGLRKALLNFGGDIGTILRSDRSCACSI
jgi:hypothetical protein